MNVKHPTLFNPYPKLVTEFGRAFLSRPNMTIDRIDDAAKALATQGREAAAMILGEPQ